MSTPIPTSTTSQLTPEELHRAQQYKTAIHYTSLGALFLCPLLILVPPRTTLRTSLLLFGAGIGGNQLASEYSGSSLLQRAQQRVKYLAATDLPPKAQEVQARLREERRRMNNADAVAVDAVGEKRERGVMGKLWMGDEGEDWKRKRDEKEKEALEEGRGYGGLIMDQIWEVWNWGKKEAEDVKEKDEEVVKARKEDK